jgi:hypothetical protein
VQEIVDKADGSGGWVPVVKSKAARVVLRVLAHAEPVKLAVTVASVFLLRHRSPHLFHSQRGFNTQLARTFSRGTYLDAHGQRARVRAHGTFWNDEAGKVEGVYRVESPRVIAAIADTLTEVYSRFVSLALRKLDQDVQRVPAVKQNLEEAFETLPARRPKKYTKHNLAWWASGGNIGNETPEKRAARLKKAVLHHPRRKPAITPP